MNQGQPWTGQAWTLILLRASRKPSVCNGGGCLSGSEGVFIGSDTGQDGGESIANQVPMTDVAGVEALKGGLPAYAVLVGRVVSDANGVGTAALDVCKTKLVYDLNVGNGNGLGRADASIFNLFDGDAYHKGQASSTHQRGSQSLHSWRGVGVEGTARPERLLLRRSATSWNGVVLRGSKRVTVAQPSKSAFSKFS